MQNHTSAAIQRSFFSPSVQLCNIDRQDIGADQFARWIWAAYRATAAAPTDSRNFFAPSTFR